MRLADYIKKLIAANRTEQALKALQQYAVPADDSLERKLVLHNSNFSRIREDKEKGNLSKVEEQLFFSRLHNALIDIADELPGELSVEVSSREKAHLTARQLLLRYGYWLLLAFWAAIAGLGVLLQSQYRQPVNVIIEVTASRASFITKGKNEITAGQPFRSIELGNVSKVEVPASEIILRESFAGPAVPYSLKEGLLGIAPIPGNESGLFFEQAMLEALAIPRQTQLTLTVPDEAIPGEHYLSLDFKPGNIQGRLSFRDSIFFQGSAIHLEGLEQAERTVSLGLITAHAPRGEAYEISFSGQKAHSYLTLEPMEGDGIAIEKQSIMVDSLSFIRPIDATSATSSILTGNVLFLSKRNRPYRQVALSRQDYLRPLGYESLELTYLKLGRDFIQLKMAGEIEQVFSGPNLEGQALLNPGILEWLWFNRPGWIFGGLGGSLLASLALGMYIRRAGRL